MRLLPALLAACAALLSSGARAEIWPTPASELERLRGGSEADRIQAAIAAASSPSRIRESVWAELVRDPSPEVRVRVLLESAGSLVSDDLSAKIAELALDSDDHVSEAALVWLRGASEVVLPALSRALFSSRGAVRAGAALALGELKGGPDEAREGLLIGALRDSEPAVRSQAARALGASARDRALPSLSLLLRDPDPSARKEAAFALAATGDETAAGLLRQVIGELSPRVPLELLAGYLETRQGRADPLSLRLLVATLRSAESRAGFTLLARVSPSPWLTRLFELSSTLAGHDTVRRLLPTFDFEPTRPAVELLEARVRGCVERDAELLCHKWAQGLLPDAALTRVLAYRARRLTAHEVFEGVGPSDWPEVGALALELLEGGDRDARRAALRALERDGVPMEDISEPLAVFLESPGLAHDEVSSALRVLGRSSAPKARWLLEKHEGSTVPTVRRAAAEARLEQLLRESEPDCADLQRRLLGRDRIMLLHRARDLSQGALSCLVGALEGRPAAERSVLLGLLIDARFDSGKESRDLLEALAVRVFSLSRRTRGAERSLLAQLALRLGSPPEAVTLAQAGRLEPSTRAQLSLALRARGERSDLNALEKSALPHELITRLAAPSRLERVRAMLGLRQALLTGAAGKTEKDQIAERACRVLRGRDELSVASAIALVGALGPEGAGGACWRDATVRSYMSKELPQRMAAVLVARKWPRDPAAGRVLRLCRLREQEVGLVGWCSRDPGEKGAGGEGEAEVASSAHVAPRLVSRRLVGAPGISAVFLSFIAEDGELKDLELEFVDPGGRRLIPEGRETVLALPL